MGKLSFFSSLVRTDQRLVFQTKYKCTFATLEIQEGISRQKILLLRESERERERERERKVCSMFFNVAKFTAFSDFLLKSCLQRMMMLSKIAVATYLAFKLGSSE